MEKSMADQFLEQQQAAQEQQQAEAEKEAEKAKDRDYQPEHITPPQPEQEQPSRHVDLDNMADIRTETAKLNERQAAAIQHHLQDQMPELSGKEIENIRTLGDAEAGRLSASQQHEQEQEELER
ncbi:hypothetical protein HF670_08005 [Acidithiobacillus thiooxidans]|uniref:hypothetical protein n=1 Tax=Acidithiobacillus thiooxidans TaxID=930 RepID=UPI001C06DE74|nr:hypothetical protein [Acidithiobacillus thiooxidans]MBU2839505.1 hypothetical protein [Acidithiobacillus thiooxidans]MBU2841875.1 hypothetical protein [Acidithiobacillus thiooxidans]